MSRVWLGASHDCSTVTWGTAEVLSSAKYRSAPTDGVLHKSFGVQHLHYTLNSSAERDHMKTKTGFMQLADNNNTARMEKDFLPCLLLLLLKSYTKYKIKITACAVATSCCISDEPCQWEKANFDPPQLRHTRITDRQTDRCKYT